MAKSSCCVEIGRGEQYRLLCRCRQKRTNPTDVLMPGMTSNLENHD